MKNKIKYLIIILVVVGVSLAGGYATSLGLESWYPSLKFPSFVPSGSFIGLVWTVIYILSAISAMIFFGKDRKKTENYSAVLTLFIANAILNLLWSFIFFAWHNIEWAFYEMLVLEATNLFLIIYSWKSSKISSVLLIPYLLWVGFASYLTLQILFLN